MGKRDTRVAWVNPIALARAQGPPPISGPTIKDYLSRPRPSLDEVKEKMAKNKREVSGLAIWEQKMQQEERKALDLRREALLGGGSKVKKSKKKKKTSTRLEKGSLHSHSHSNSETNTDSDSELESKRRKRHHKSKKHRDSKGAQRLSSDEDSSHYKKVKQSRKRKKIRRQ